MKNIFTLIALLFTSASYAQWVPMGSGLNAEALALTFYNGELYAAGNFTVAGDTTANYIARWDGSKWYPVGGGMNATVRALAVYQGELYAGGDFSVAGGTTARGIAKWNGASWDSVGTGVNDSGWVSALAVYNGELYAGGHYSAIGGLASNNIARWNGSSWSGAGYGFSSQFFPITVVRALYTNGNTLYAAGAFDQAETEFAVGVAEWDGTIWSDLNVGFNHEGRCITAYSGFLYVGGSFNQTIASSQPMKGFGQWDGTNWEQIGSGVDSTVCAMAVFQNNLYLGGFFRKANNQNARHLAVWNGGTFDAVPLGTDSNIFSMVADTSALYMSGMFTTAGGVAASHIVKYTGPTSVLEAGVQNVSVFPNPSTGVINISGIISDGMLSVYNVAGQEVKTSRIEPGRNTVDLRLSSGAYFLTIRTNEQPVYSAPLLITE